MAKGAKPECKRLAHYVGVILVIAPQRVFEKSLYRVIASAAKQSLP
jgi:hypothetical protein